VAALPFLAFGENTEELVWQKSSNCRSSVQNGVLHQQLLQDSQFDGMVHCEPTAWEKGSEYEFSCDVEAPSKGMAYLQVKFYRDGRETNRISSNRNRRLNEALRIRFNPENADKIQLLCRIVRRSGNLNKTVYWKNFYFGSPRPERQQASPTLPRLEIIPGYQVCGVYLNSCQAEDYPQISGTLQVRRHGTTAWLPALAPAYVRHEKSLRGSLLQLKENTAYEVKLSVTDCGKTEEFIREFRTKNSVVPIARTIRLSAKDGGANWTPQSGTPNGYIRYTADPGCVIAPGKQAEAALQLDGVGYIILDGLTIRGGRKHGISITNSHHIQVLNCDIAGYGRRGIFRPDLDGKYYHGGKSIWHDAGIRIFYSDDILAERNYIHDPDAFGNSWFYSHPAGPTGFHVGESASVALRYNDIIGSDLKRWNDGVDGSDNFDFYGGFRRDAEICGNYFAFGDDDGLELDGGQMNARFFHNRVEGFLCGVSLANCMRGPSYVFQNEFLNAGDEYDFGGRCIKMISGISSAWGPVYLLHNAILWEAGGLSAPHQLPEQQTPAFLLYARGNRYADPDPYRALQNRTDFRCDIDDKQSAAPFLPATPTQYPVRPAGFSIDHNMSRFEQTDNSVHSKQVTLTANTPGFKTSFRIVQPEATRHFKVEPASGTLEFGKPVTLTVSSCPEAIPVPRRNTGAFAVRLSNGMSRPVSVTVDTRKNPRLLKAARAKAVYGEIKKTGDAGMDLIFHVPTPGDYYLFVTFADLVCSKALVRCDDGEVSARTIRIPLYTAPKPWVCLSELGTGKNRPFNLTAGQHTFHIERYKTYRKPAYARCALTTEPDVFRLAPDELSD
jgi:hypothetical protein